MSNIGRPEATEFAPFYARYIARVTEDDVLTALEVQTRELADAFGRISEEQGSYRYAPDKWSVKQVIGHLTDAERVFSYRAVAFARGDETSLPGFDENTYVANGGFDARTVGSLTAELAAVRWASLTAYRGFSDEAWQRRGTANDSPISVRALAYITVGHARHHLNVLRERYGMAT
jgi:hypothetical protein